MAFSNADLLAIKNELNNNPLSLTGYLPLANSANDEANAAALNLVRVECQVDRATVPSSEINKAINRDEFAAASAADRQWIAMITNGGSVDPRTGSQIRSGLLAIFGNGTQTRTALSALLTQSSSRIAQLFANGAVSVNQSVTPSDIANARNAT